MNNMKNKKIPAICIILAAVLLAACGKAEQDAGDATARYHKLDQNQAKERMDSGDEITILDVRTQEEYEEKHIPGAICIPNETIGEEALDELPDKDAEIFVYCRSGVRSREASEKLAGAGYTNIYDIGGIKDWPYETVSGEEKDGD